MTAKIHISKIFQVPAWFYGLFLVLGNIFPIPTNAFSGRIPGNGNTGSYLVRIARESYLIINGYTNFNNFSCIYEGDFYRDTLTVKAVSDGDHVTLSDARLLLKTDLFDCHNPGMNEDFRDLLNSGKYPFIRIQVVDINKNQQEINARLVSLNDKKYILLKVSIQIAGEENTYDLPVEILKKNNGLFYSGRLNLNIRDFGLVPPVKMFGLVRVKEFVSIDFMVKINLI